MVVDTSDIRTQLCKKNGRLVVTCFQDTFEALMTVCIILYPLVI